ncbi:MAG: nucleoside deaminase [Solirubrobacterales bacterium]
MSAFSEVDERMMTRALELAKAAAGGGDVPIGAVVARDGDVLGEAGNERELRGDPTAHAEVLALQAAARRVGGWRLPETTLYVTLEPCLMCAGAASLARVPRIVFGASDPKGGALGGAADAFAPPSADALNHLPAVEAGLLADECAAPLTAFFARRRG